MSQDQLSYAVENGNAKAKDRICGNCKFFDDSKRAELMDSHLGRCKVNPPEIVVKEDTFMSGWPVVETSEKCCGQYIQLWEG